MAKILYVEDDEMNRDMLSRRLTRREHEVSLAFDGQEGLENMSLLHYTGSMKPWTIRAAFNKRAIFYHDAYYELFKKKYKIINTWKVSALTQLLNGIFKLYFKNLRYPISFFYIAILSLFKPSKSNE